MQLRKKDPESTFRVYARDQGGCGAKLPSLAKGAVEFTLTNEEVNAWVHRFDVLCRQEADGGYFVLSVPNAGSSTRRGGTFCLFSYRVGPNGFSTSVERIPQVHYCSSGGVEDLALVFLVDDGRVVGILAAYQVMGAHPPTSRYFSVFFVKATERPVGGEPLLLRTVMAGGSIVAYTIDEEWRQGHGSGCKQLRRVHGRPALEYGRRAFVLRRLCAEDDILDCQIVDNTTIGWASATPGDERSREKILLQHLGRLTGRLEKETEGTSIVVFPGR